jgi:hypothetical protein
MSEPETQEQEAMRKFGESGILDRFRVVCDNQDYLQLEVLAKIVCTDCEGSFIDDHDQLACLNL